MDTKDLLTERGKTHGPYELHAAITCAIKANMRYHMVNDISVWHKLDPCMAESLDMIAHKIGRILAGDPDFRDHWDDIAGYAKLVAERCTK